ncbi:MAG: KpsF/GutQ family sugar-phosphate isomerase [Alphaproteobacteria bacterium]|nr:KpsF/GutQ family sugar-phosphate isomerase [Alphaproteobacteria bacterium]
MTQPQGAGRAPATGNGATPGADVGVGRRVLGLEAEALRQLAEALDARFVGAVEILLAARGRVVVSGMGKSGLVGRKIAATLASTGTPAQFVHPGEASHGDLGMITAGDAVIALSNSGETRELSDLIAHTRLRGIPLIAVSGRAGSTLVRTADVALVLPPAAEACAIGLAPTTSTTMMMALGDALAVALMERRGFSPDDYRVLHPGGSLGQSLLRVSDLMHRGEAMPLVSLGTPMRDVLLTMTSRAFGCTGVLDADGGLVGIITDGDLRRHMGPDLLAHAAGDIMTPRPKTVRPELLAVEALRLMTTNRPTINGLFVVGQGAARPLGFLHVHDCIRAGIDPPRPSDRPAEGDEGGGKEAE